MRYFLWLPLRISALILLPILAVSGFLRATLRGFTGADVDSGSSSPLGCLMQFILLPAYAPIALIYLTVRRFFNEIMVHDIKFGFARPDKFYHVAIKLTGEERNMRMLYEITLAERGGQ